MMNEQFRNKITGMITNQSRFSPSDPYVLDSFQFMAIQDVTVRGMLTLYETGLLTWIQFLTEMAVRQTAMRVLLDDDFTKLKTQLVTVMHKIESVEQVVAKSTGVPEDMLDITQATNYAPTYHNFAR